MAAATRPNVVVIFTDQQRFDSTGVHGNPLELTPNFDRLAMEGTHLFNGYTCQPVCGPARACLQTGQYATRVGCYRNDLRLPPDATTLAKCFNAAGYHTGYIGKWHLADWRTMNHHGPVAPEERGGYQEWLASNILEFTSDAYHTRLWNTDNQPVDLPGYRVDALTDAAIRFIDRRQREPFFLFLSYIEPHFQNHLDDFPPPVGYRERYTGRWIPPDLATLGGTTHQHLGGYWGMVKRLDEALGRLQDTLKSLNLDENTILLFTTDHGCHFKTRNGEYKRSCHESSVRIPMAFSGPGFDGGGRVREMVSLVDMPPTLLDACGLPVPESMQGRSILPLLHGAKTDWPKEAFVQISESQVGRAIRTRRWKYSVIAPDKNGWSDSSSDVYREDCLYDLDCDPYELTNLIGLESHRALCDKLMARLVRRMVEAGEAAPRIEKATSRPKGQRFVDPAALEEV